MSSIEKLAIRGIRSFGSGTEEAIEFYKPLTVIVGPNGCGKTTIIECLKYVTTGSLPPNAKNGQYFVHDPKLEDTKEVHANIKLLFRNRARRKTVVIRSFKLTEKRTKREFKALDGTIKVQNKDGKQETQTNRCSDLDQIVPDILGVSRAILENVIFCHQEDSNWPLQEGAVLKKRFDEIFESTRYTKALDALKKHRKATTDDYKDAERDLTILEDRIKTAKGKRRDLDTLKGNFDRVKAQQDSINEKLVASAEKLAAVEAVVDKVRTLENGIREADVSLKEKQQTLKRKRETLDDNLVNVEGELEQLEESLANSDKTIEAMETRREREESKLTQIEQKLKQARVDGINLQSDQAVLKSNMDDMESASKTFCRLHMQLAGKWKLEQGADYATAMTDETGKKLELLLRSIQKAKDDMQQKLESQEKEKDNAVEEQQDKVNLARNKENEVSVKKTHLTEKKAKAQATLAKVNQQLQQIGTDGPNTQAEINRVQEQLAKYKREQEQANIPSKIQSTRDEMEQTRKAISDADFEISRLDEYVEKLEKKQGDMASLKHTREKLEQLQSDLVSQLEASRHELAKVAANGVPANLTCPVDLSQTFTATSATECVNPLCEFVANIEKVHSNAIEHESALLRKYENDLLQLTTREQQHNKRVETIRKQVEEREADIPKREFYDIMDSYASDLGDRNNCYDTQAILALMDEKVNSLLSEATIDKNAKTLMKRQIERTKRYQCCPTCEQDLDDLEFVLEEDVDDRQISADVIPKGVYRGVKALEAQLASRFLDKRFENKVQASQAKYEEAKAERDSVQRHMPKYTVVQNLKTELEKLENADVFLQFTTQKDTLRENIQACKSKVDHELTPRKTATRYLMSDLEKLQRMSRECIRTKAELRQEELVLGISADDGELDLSSKREEVKLKRRNRSELQKQFDSSSKQVETLQAENQRFFKRINDLQTLLFELQKSSGQRDKLDIQKRELKLEDTSLSSEISDLHAKQMSLSRDTKLLEDVLRRLRITHSEKIDATRREVETIADDYNQLSAQLNVVKKHQRANVRAQLQAVTEKLTLNMQNIARHEGMQTESKRIISELSAKLAQSSSIQQQIRELVDMLRIQQEISEVSTKRAKLESKLVEVTGSADIASSGIDQHRRKVEKYNIEYATLEGTLNELKRSISDCKRILKSEQYRGIDENYRAKMITVHTTKMACNDLDRYQKTLDNALMQFHHMKIAEINKRIRDIWQVTYKGADIERIELKAEATKTARGSYNYRVVMTKGDSELDMRGRSSAGQRCLASLVIRLALAETFSVNCGILALDEPTTNLDDHNKQGLAVALGQLIASRKQQKNFQLIIITHDEEFVDLLRHQDVQEGGYYFRVSRQGVDNRFVSRIEKQEWD